MFGLGSSDLRGVLNRLGCFSIEDGSNGESVFVDGSFTFENWGNGEFVFVDGGNERLNLWDGRGNWQVSGLNTESQMISNVLSGLDDTIGINIVESSGDSSVGVSDFVFLRVDVSITVLEIAKFILSLELRRGSNWGGDGSGYGSSIGVGTCGSIGVGSCVVNGGCASIANRYTIDMGISNLLSRRSGNTGQKNKSVHCEMCVLCEAKR